MEPERPWDSHDVRGLTWPSCFPSWTDISLGPSHWQSDRPGARRPLQMDHVSVLGTAPHVSEEPAQPVLFARAEKSGLACRALLLCAFLPLREKGCVQGCAEGVCAGERPLRWAGKNPCTSDPGVAAAAHSPCEVAGEAAARLCCFCPIRKTHWPAESNVFVVLGERLVCWAGSRKACLPAWCPSSSSAECPPALLRPGCLCHLVDLWSGLIICAAPLSLRSAEALSGRGGRRGAVVVNNQRHYRKK